jgi:hypothetical protein
MDKTFKHFIITRFNIPAKYAGRKNQNISMVDPKTDEKYLDNRIRLFEKYTFPSIKQIKILSGWYYLVIRHQKNTKII